MKKLITLLTLLLTVCSGAWASNETLSWTDMAISNHDANKAGAATSANLTPANGVVVNLETNGTVTKDFGSGSTTYYRYKGFGVDEDTDKSVLAQLYYRFAGVYDEKDDIKAAAYFIAES